MALQYLPILALIPTIVCDTTVTYQTKLGQIQGLFATTNFGNITKNYTVFKRIPFAKPPIGDLRFRRPLPYGLWNGTLDATTFGPSCLQEHLPQYDKYLPNINQSEDCLFLNIYVPASATSSNKLSVMVWIHGGGYVSGEGMLYDGSVLSVVGDVIVVTINYRLNVFGFFRTTKTDFPGNFGLYDQQLAMKWVKDHIGSFYGDSQSITIFGESAGGFSVALQAVNPDNKGLFKRVIEQSGASSSFFSTTPKPFTVYKSIMSALNCSKNTMHESKRCMQNKPANDILNEYLKLLSVGSAPEKLDMHQIAYVAPAFNYSTEDIIAYRNTSSFEFYKSLDVLIGTCEGEGSLIVGALHSKQKYLSFNVSKGITTDYLCKHLVSPIIDDYFHNNTAIRDNICKKYSSNTSLQEQAQNVIDFYGDLFFYLPAVQSLNSHAVNNYKTKQFQYSFYPRSIFSPALDIFPWFKGGGHAAEISYLFPTTLLLPNPTPDDFALSYSMMKYWSNFAKTGDVNGQGLPRWPEYDNTSKAYALLDFPISVQNSLYKDRMEFWLKTILPQHTRQRPCTSPDCIFG